MKTLLLGMLLTGCALDVSDAGQNPCKYVERDLAVCDFEPYVHQLVCDEPEPDPDGESCRAGKQADGIARQVAGKSPVWCCR